MMRDLGLEGMYMGLSAKIIQTVLNNGFLHVTYEKLRVITKFFVLFLLRKYKYIQ